MTKELTPKTQTGKIIAVKGEYFLETTDPNNPKKNLLEPLSLAGKESFEDAVGKEVTVVLSEPLRSIAAFKVGNHRPICYVPIAINANVLIDTETSKAIAKTLLAQNVINQALYEMIVGE